MAYKSYRYNRRAIRRIAKKSKRNFIISLFLIIVFAYITLLWILPNFIGLLGFIKESVSQPAEKIRPEDTNAPLAPPILNIPFEATNTSQISIQGYATADSEIKLYIDDKENQTTKSTSDGSFTFQNIQLVLGTNNIYGKTIDDKGKNSLPSKTIRVIFDSERPILEISEPEDGNTVQGERKIKIAGKTEKGAKIIVNGNQIIVDKDGNFSSEQSLNNGENIFTIKALDSASNFTEDTRKVNFTP